MALSGEASGITLKDIRTAVKLLREEGRRRPRFRAWGWPFKVTFDKYDMSWGDMHGCFFVLNNIPHIFVSISDIKDTFPHSWVRQTIKTFSHEFTHYVQWLMGHDYWSESETLLDRYEDELMAYKVGEGVGLLLLARPRNVEEGAIASTASAATFMLRNTKRAELFWGIDKQFDEEVIQMLHNLEIPTTHGRGWEPVDEPTV